MEVGQVTARLGAHFDDRAFDQYDRAIAKAKRHDDIKTEAKLDVDKRGFHKYDRVTRDAERRNKDVVSSNARLRTSFGTVWGRGGAAFAAAGGATALTVAGKAVIGTATAINESLSKNDVLFGKYAKSVAQFSDSSAKSFGISKAAALDATGTFGNLFVALDIGPKKAADMSVGLTRLAADLASFNNASPEEALEAIRSGLVGETEPLRKFGVNLNDAALRTEALRQGLIKNTKEALTPQQKALAVNVLLFKQTEKAQGDFARTSGGLANQQRILRARLSDISATIGAKLLPAATKGATAINDLLSGKGVGSTVSRSLGKAFHFIGTVVDDNRKSLRRLGEAFSGLWGPISSSVRKIVDAFSRAFSGRGSLGQDVRSIIRVLTAFTTFLMARVVIPITRRILPGIVQAFQGLARIIRGVVQVIAGVLTLDFRKAWEGVKNIFGGSIKALGGMIRAATAPFRAAAAAVGRAIGSAFSAAWDGVKKLFSAGLGVALSVLRKYVGLHRAAAQRIGEAILAGFNLLAKLPGKIGGWLGQSAHKLVAWAGNFGKSALKIGEAIVKGIIDGLADLPKKLADKIGGAVKGVPGKVGGLAKGAAGKLGIGDYIAGLAPISGPGGGALQRPGGAGSSKAVSVGKQLQRMGFSVSENPAFGGVAGVHAPGSYHYSGRAIDVNADAMPGGEGRNIDRIFPMLKALNPAELLWRVAGHFDHLHVAFAQGGKVQQPMFMVGEEAPAHPEYILSTNPRDRQRMIPLAFEALRDLGVPGFKRGGKRGGKKAKPAPKAILRHTGHSPAVREREHGIADFESDISAMERRYAQIDRIFGLSQEEYVVERDDGTSELNQPGIQARVAEIDKLRAARESIRKKILAYRKRVQELLATYRKAIARIAKALGAAKGKRRAKERAAYRQTIEDYQGRMGELRKLFPQLGGDAEDSRIDSLELRAERAEILGTTVPGAALEGPSAEDAGADIGGDPGSGPGSGDTADTPSAPTAEQVAEAAAQQLASFNAGRAELFASFGQNFNRTGSAMFATETQRAAGMRYFGAVGADSPDVLSAAGGGATTVQVTNNYAAPPEDPHSWSQGIGWELRQAV